MDGKFIGFHENADLPVKRGDTVTILKGTKIRTTSPGITTPYLTKTAGRTYKVKVDHVLNGMNHPVGHPRHTKGYEVHNPSVRWPGTGGYWHEVDINDIPEAQAAINARIETSPEFSAWKDECHKAAVELVGIDDLLAKDDPYDVNDSMREAFKEGESAVSFVAESFEEDIARGEADDQEYAESLEHELYEGEDA